MELIRNCPECEKEIKYKREQNFINANKIGSLCKSCAQKGDRNWTRKPKYFGYFSGENNPMYGKSVYEVWLEKYGKDEADIRSNEWKRKVSENNAKNMQGRSLYEVWLEKYGKDEAEERLATYKNKISIATSGKNNPMYGKPAPEGSGNGWSGWYKGIFFRSLLELSYLKYLIDNNINFENAECRKYKIELDGIEKNYFPDFYLIDSAEIVEIKPKNLINTDDNKIKFKAAKEKHGNRFKVITDDEIIRITDDEIKNLHESGDLVFIERYERKYKEKYNDR